MGRAAVQVHINNLTKSINDLRGPFIDKTSDLEKALRSKRNAYQAVWNGRRVDELVLPFNPRERELFVAAYNEAMEILER
jgi:hypothetical protein